MSRFADTWRKLWDIATGDPSGDATVELTDDPEAVVLVWKDGSKSALRLERGEWRHCGSADLAPCDVAARDAF